MEEYNLEKDIKIFYVTATSFPEGISAAHEKLQNLLPDIKDRHFYGVSRPENNKGIIYKAGVEESYQGEGETLGFDTLILKQGKYIGALIKDYTKDVSIVEKTFQKILKNPDLDPNGYCVEMYIGQKDLRCMVRLKD
ncbi:MAG: transcriptional regulator [Bacteroidia bacterium]